MELRPADISVLFRGLKAKETTFTDSNVVVQEMKQNQKKKRDPRHKGWGGRGTEGDRDRDSERDGQRETGRERDGERKGNKDRERVRKTGKYECAHTPSHTPAHTQIHNTKTPFQARKALIANYRTSEQAEGHLKEVVLEQHLHLVMLPRVPRCPPALFPFGEVHESHVFVIHQNLVHALAHLEVQTNMLQQTPPQVRYNKNGVHKQ